MVVEGGGVGGGVTVKIRLAYHKKFKMFGLANGTWLVSLSLYFLFFPVFTSNITSPSLIQTGVYQNLKVCVCVCVCVYVCVCFESV